MTDDATLVAAIVSRGAAGNTAGPSGTCEGPVCRAQDIAARATDNDQVATRMRMVFILLRASPVAAAQRAAVERPAVTVTRMKQLALSPV